MDFEYFLDFSFFFSLFFSIIRYDDAILISLFLFTFTIHPMMMMLEFCWILLMLGSFLFFVNYGLLTFEFLAISSLSLFLVELMVILNLYYFLIFTQLLETISCKLLPSPSIYLYLCYQIYSLFLFPIFTSSCLLPQNLYIFDCY